MADKQANQIKLDREYFNLVTVLKEAIEIQKENAKRGGIEVLLDLSGSDTKMCDEVSGDSEKTRLCLASILRDAIEMSNSNSILIVNLNSESNQIFLEADEMSNMKSPAHLDIVSHSSKKSTEVEFHNANFTIEVMINC